MSFIDSLENMLFGDPVYDERGQVVKRNFGGGRAAVLYFAVVLLFAYLAFRSLDTESKFKSKVKSGKKKMKGGSLSDDRGMKGFIEFANTKFGKISIGCLLVVAAIFVYFISNLPQH
jgi:hypothetical protein|tara:strand:- start:648 stop:998 length:351 start_codon:yes stop_codon:yes gene_type:complete